MIKIKTASEANIDVLALLGRITYAESHGRFIDSKNELLEYVDKAFSVSKTKQDITNPEILFYIIYVDDLPVGYAKLILNATHENVVSKNSCLLDRIYILNDFLPLKLGQQLLNFVIEQAKKLGLDTLWLSVYIKNDRAIRFYHRNQFLNVGDQSFLVSGKAYENTVFSKNI